MVDFMANDQGVIPILKSPVPEFTIGITRELFEDDRPAEPDWFRKSDNHPDYESNVANWSQKVKECYERMSSSGSESNILRLMRTLDGNISTIGFNLLSSATDNKLLFTDESFDVFGKFTSSGNAEILTEAGLWIPEEVELFKVLWDMDHTNKSRV